MVFLKVVLVGLASPRGLTVQCFPQEYFSPTPPFHFTPPTANRFLPLTSAVFVGPIFA